MIAKTKCQFWKQANELLLKTNTNAENKQICDCWKQTSILIIRKLMIAGYKQIIDCWKQTSILITNKSMIAVNKHQCWYQANQWLLKTNINAENKQINDC